MCTGNNATPDCERDKGSGAQSTDHGERRNVAGACRRESGIDYFLLLLWRIRSTITVSIDCQLWDQREREAWSWRAQQEKWRREVIRLNRTNGDGGAMSLRCWDRSGIVVQRREHEQRRIGSQKRFDATFVLIREGSEDGLGSR
ncbi:hypothetical protein Mapa_007086 [Marchantia paleacea]|nr:hypothetical protein Mapa_007086 [Marchantia paleacea]